VNIADLLRKNFADGKLRLHCARNSMSARIKILFAQIWLAPALLFAANVVYRPAIITPPEPAREFRGAWLVTLSVTNVDWPPRPGLTVEQQKAEMISLLDRAAQLKLNVILFQVRPASDALYASPFEPWSEYLTGTQGLPPQPLYDPLAFAIAEAHKRGLELHAWFNPFRARHADAKSPAALNHISRTHPELVHLYGDQLWLDPGEPAAREHVLRVVMDVVQRYDVDGVAFDDYFYPYPLKDPEGGVEDFPDGASWQKYGLRSGLTRPDWRRANVNNFVQCIYAGIKGLKPWVKFSISPFGIWRPLNPPQIRGLDAYTSLYADSRLWLAAGWVDYLAPQLYWPIDDTPHSFSVLLNWWSAQNVKGRQVLSALDAAGVGEKFSAYEIARQMQITRATPGARGEIFYHLRNLEDNPALAQILRTQYTQPALTPATPWLGSLPQNQPQLTVTVNAQTNLDMHWQMPDGALPRLWLLQRRATNGVWTTEILPATQTSRMLVSSSLPVISVRAVDRNGNLSEPAVMAPSRTTPVRNGKGMP
jgi:uncharacterized lipoprotein YddW (UPF0748 family)